MSTSSGSAASLGLGSETVGCGGRSMEWLAREFHYE
jgi:hypothetical protein